jgi:gliding motility-associated-like protein
MVFAGTWSPSTISTATVGTTTYTFTPTDPCATVTTMDITIGTQVTPTFTQIGPLCQNSTAPALPATSDNGFTGTWNPATINTATVGTTTYTFTPTDPCATTATMDVTISTQVTPTFTQIGPLCQNSTAPALPATSDNGFTGTWSPATINTATVGATTYTFTPNDPCATQAAMIVTINPGISPNVVITNPAPVCEPGTVDLTNPNITANSTPGLTYTYWQDAAGTVPLPDPTAVGQSGTYYIKGTATGGCSSTQPVQVIVKVTDAIPGTTLPPVSTAANTPTQLSARDLQGGGYTYQWYPPVGINFDNIKNPTFNYNQQTQYTITMTPADGTCPTVDTLLVTLSTQTIQSALDVPNAWSPNGDGHNDRLYPLTIKIKELKYFRVYNRWGQLMFETHTLGQGWDGTFNGQPQVMDVYTWIVEATERMEFTIRKQVIPF